jgi:hypothetical protein
MRKRWCILLLIMQCSSTWLFGQTLSGDIEVYINEYIDDLPLKNGNDYSIPEATDLLTWEEIILHLLNEELTEARQKAEMVNYQVVEFTDTSMVPHLYCYLIEEKSNRMNYWGTYILNPNPLRKNLIIQSPHPVYDTHTGKQGIFCFKKVGASAFFISGAHRCNHTDSSPCSGTTTVCDGSSAPYRVSDNPHNVVSIFQKTTEVLFSELENSVFVQLHGFAKLAGDPYVIMSNGTRLAPDPDYISLLMQELFNTDNSLTFKIAHIDLDWSRLIAFSNVQGRFINNSDNPCTENATTCTGRFIHIEQEKSKLRENATGWLKMSEALSKTFPETPVSAGSSTTEHNFHVSIYPNPTDGILHISAAEPIRISIFNVTGACIYEFHFDSDIPEIDLSSQAQGIYFIRVMNQEGFSTSRIILKK